MRFYIGLLMIFSLFMGFFVFMGLNSSWLVAIQVYGFAAIVTTFIGVATHLMVVKESDK